MAGWFAHLLVAQRVLEKLPQSKRSFLSGFSQLDDYLFGSIAPDIRYVSKVDASLTHKPFGKESAFAAFNTKTPFVAGYETHLIADDKWADIVKFFKVDTTKEEQKFALYFGIDRYLQLKSGWLSPIAFSGNIARADNVYELESLGFNQAQISAFKSIVSSYLLLPDAASLASFITGLSFPLRLPPRFKENVVVDIVDSLVIPKAKINGFLSDSVSAAVKEVKSNL